MTSVQIIVCTNRGMDPRFVTCLLHARHPEISITFGIESLIDRSRSVMATKFLDGNSDICLFIDDDIIGWSIEDINQIVADVVETGSIVGGCYSIKNVANPRICALGIDKGTGSFDIGPQNGLVEVKYVATGFMAIPRKILAELATKLPKVNAYGDLPMHPFFQPFVHEGIYLSEDYAFCQKARELGYKIWLDPRIILGHIGSFVYNLS